LASPNIDVIFRYKEIKEKRYEPNTN
jgi:hypothetical protein